MSAVDSWEICSQRGSRTAQTRTEERPRLLPGFVFCMGRSLCSPNPTPHAPGQSEEASAMVLGPQSSTGRRRERVMHGRARAGSTAAKSGWSSSACVSCTCVCAGTGACRFICNCTSTCARTPLLHLQEAPRNRCSGGKEHACATL